ncbi:craniofacial development protein 2-like, partial [Moschus berezovskii]|uniref:craniofacial development protein 2-like n=1 Tax=Moschus berezovskii TaxID=68408 RepID=UPI00244403C8
DVTSDRNKVQCCKEQHCIGTWNVRSMNQGKLEVVKQEMARVNVDILGISELKWTGMGEFNSDDHYIYYCGQESLRRNGVAIMVNKRVRNAVLGCNLKNDRMISVRFQGKPFNITVIQAYAPTSNAEEAEVNRFYEDLQDLLELTPKKDVLFIIGDWNAKVGSQETPGVTGKFGLGARNEAGQRLIEFCQENALVIANTLFQQHKRRLYTWTSPDGQHRNQIDYILCNQRWRSCIQLAKTRPGADCGSDHELLIAKFRLKLKKVGKTTRPVIRREHGLESEENERSALPHIAAALRVSLGNWDQGVGRCEDKHMNCLNFILMADGKGLRSPDSPSNVIATLSDSLTLNDHIASHGATLAHTTHLRVPTPKTHIRIDSVSDQMPFEPILPHLHASAPTHPFTLR